MFLSAPGKTPYDLNFNLLGFPVRVHPAFFILPALFSQGFMRLYSEELNAGVVILIIASVFFLSVLIHELGHTLAFRFFGIDSHIVLYWMGGLAIPGGGMGAWNGGRTKRLNPNEQIVVSLAGPAAGLLLGGLFVLIAYGITGSIRIAWMGPIPMFWYDAVGILESAPLDLFVRASIMINIILNLFNLLPVFPLDGGQVARQLFVKADPYTGARNSMMLSMAVAVIIALLALSNKDSFLAIFFGFMAWSNFQALSMQGGGRRPW